MKLFTIVLPAAALAILCIFTQTSNRQELKSQTESSLVPTLKNSVFKSRLTHGPIRTIGGKAYQCWNEGTAGRDGLALLTTRFLPTDAIVRKIDATQFVCGKSALRTGAELDQTKRRFKAFVTNQATADDLDLCEASAIHFLIRDVAKKSAFNTARCPI